MPLKNKVAYSVVCISPNGYKTLCLYDKNNKLIEYRACDYDAKTKKFTCPRQSTHPKERKQLQKKLGI